MGNHLVSHSEATINATDDLSTIDPDENILNLAGGPRRRRHDEDDELSDGLVDDDLESMANAPLNGLAGKPVEEEKEAPPHACA